MIGRRIGYVGAGRYMFTGSLRDNLLLRAAPPAAAAGGTVTSAAEARTAAPRQLDEARASGNIDFDPLTPTGSITRRPGSRMAES